MALREVLIDGDPLLRKKSKEIKQFDQELEEILDDMYDTMIANNGCGIAGPQIGILRRIFIIDIEGMKVEFINPEIIEQSGSCILPEGCLSVPNRQEYVARPIYIKVKAYTRKGTPFEMIANDYVARVICHENDHLNGILYIDKIAKYAKNKE